jgi:hypothetical protein
MQTLLPDLWTRGFMMDPYTLWKGICSGAIFK